MHFFPPYEYLDIHREEQTSYRLQNRSVLTTEQNKMKPGEVTNYSKILYTINGGLTESQNTTLNSL